MPQWRVEGADRETGEDRVIVVDGPTREDAQRQAGRAGVMVSAIKAYTFENQNPPPALAYAPPARDNRPPKIVPSYTAIYTLASILSGVGWVMTGLGVLLLAIGAMASMNTRAGDIDVMPMVTTFGPAIACAVWGIVLLAIASLMRAIRDMAINSFHTRYAVEHGA